MNKIFLYSLFYLLFIFLSKFVNSGMINVCSESKEKIFKK